MSDSSEGFVVPKVRIAHHCRTKVRIPKITSVRMDGREVIATLECGHEAVLFVIPKRRTTCYKCQGAKVEWTEAVQGTRTIPLATKTLQ